MKNGYRIAIAAAALTAGLAFAGASRANAQVSFRGSFPLPHGRISIGIGDPAFRVGAYVPRGYRVYSRSGYGYGFAYRDRWIPVRRYGSQWMVCESPYLDGAYADDSYADDYYAPSYSREIYVERPYTNRIYINRGFGSRGFSRRDFDRRDFRDGRRFDRNDHRNDRRNDRRDDRRDDHRSDRNHDRRDGRGDWRH